MKNWWLNFIAVAEKKNRKLVLPCSSAQTAVQKLDLNPLRIYVMQELTVLGQKERLHCRRCCRANLEYKTAISDRVSCDEVLFHFSDYIYIYSQNSRVTNNENGTYVKVISIMSIREVWPSHHYFHTTCKYSTVLCADLLYQI